MTPKTARDGLESHHRQLVRVLFGPVFGNKAEIEGRAVCQDYP